jgi:hypothetical protein
MGPTPLKVGPTGSPETSVWNYHCTLRNIPGQRRGQDRKYLYSLPEAHLDRYCLVPSHMVVLFITMLSDFVLHRCADADSGGRAL